MFRALKTLLLVTAAFWHGAHPANSHAGIDVDFWSLNTAVSSQGENDLETINDIHNPFIYTSLSAIGDNSVYSAMDNAWNVDTGVGHFLAEIRQQIRSPEIVATVSNRIHILPTEDLYITLTGSLTYAHTPGDEGAINFGASIRNLSTNQLVLSDYNSGGNLYLLPAAGQLTMSAEAILQSGTVYRLQVVVDSDNISDPLPTGIMDSAGFVRFDVRPVPEPATLAMLMPLVLLLARRRRGLSA